MRNAISAWDAVTGANLPQYTQEIQGLAFFGAPAIADITGDGNPDIILATDSAALHRLRRHHRTADTRMAAMDRWMVARCAGGRRPDRAAARWTSPSPPARAICTFTRRRALLRPITRHGIGIRTIATRDITAMTPGRLRRSTILAVSLRRRHRHADLHRRRRRLEVRWPGRVVPGIRVERADHAGQCRFGDRYPGR